MAKYFHETYSSEIEWRHYESTNKCSAPRSVEIVLLNGSSSTLIWDDSGLEHGERSQTAPDEIAPREHGRWMLRSAGIFTGCEGWMNWRIGKEGPMIKLDYNVPWVGSNSYRIRIVPEDAKYEVKYNLGDGGNAVIVFVLKEFV